MWIFKLFGLAILTVASAAAAPAASAPGPTCPRQCLYKLLDDYLDALKIQNPARVPEAIGARYTENNVVLDIGDGLWRTVSGLGTYDLRFADPDNGTVGFYGTVDESDASSPFALRLRVVAGRIVEVETVVARPQDAGIPFLSATIAPIPELNEFLPEPERSSRDRMIAIANGYFDTLQRNDGTLHTAFADDCNRREDGMQTTNNPDPRYPTMRLGCAAQFQLGIYRYDDELRSRRFLVVDVERGLVMASAFIDHSGHLGSYTLTDGTPAQSLYRRPNTYYLMETFKIRSGKIQRIEAVFTTVPYRMPSPWSATAPRSP